MEENKKKLNQIRAKKMDMSLEDYVEQQEQEAAKLRREEEKEEEKEKKKTCLLYTSPSPRDLSTSRMPSSA